MYLFLFADKLKFIGFAAGLGIFLISVCCFSIVIYSCYCKRKCRPQTPATRRDEDDPKPDTDVTDIDLNKLAGNEGSTAKAEDGAEYSYILDKDVNNIHNAYSPPPREPSKHQYTHSPMAMTNYGYMASHEGNSPMSSQNMHPLDGGYVTPLQLQGYLTPKDVKIASTEPRIYQNISHEKMII